MNSPSTYHNQQSLWMKHIKIWNPILYYNLPKSTALTCWRTVQFQIDNTKKRRKKRFYRKYLIQILMIFPVSSQRKHGLKVIHSFIYRFITPIYTLNKFSLRRFEDSGFQFTPYRKEKIDRIRSTKPLNRIHPKTLYYDAK